MLHAGPLIEKLQGLGLGGVASLGEQTVVGKPWGGQGGPARGWGPERVLRVARGAVVQAEDPSLGSTPGRVGREGWRTPTCPPLGMWVLFKSMVGPVLRRS